MAFSGTVAPPSDWITLDNSNQFSKNARIKYKIRVICDKNYYNSTCTVLCKPRNDQFGHYTCNIKGQKVCIDGWSGDTCDKPICREGCAHGMCKSPGMCAVDKHFFVIIVMTLTFILLFFFSRRCMRVQTWI